VAGQAGQSHGEAGGGQVLRPRTQAGRRAGEAMADDDTDRPAVGRKWLSARKKRHDYLISLPEISSVPHEGPFRAIVTTLEPVGEAAGPLPTAALLFG
jgi:hypothetical protein